MENGSVVAWRRVWEAVWFPRAAHGVIEMHMLYLVVAGALTSHIINLPRSKKANTHPDVWMPREVTPESLG